MATNSNTGSISSSTVSRGHRTRSERWLAVAPADSFESAYTGTPPWDIGRPQPAIVQLAETNQITGSVLDVGCGTGENVLYLAKRGYAAAGIDRAPTAINQARVKAKRQGLTTHFDVH